MTVLRYFDKLTTQQPASIQRVPKLHNIILCDDIAAKNHQTLHDVAQFADVAGPLVLF
jgi:hypothetical protein